MTMGFFKKLADGLRKTRDAISGQVDAVLASFTKIDEELFEELEDVLIGADVGVHTTMEIVEQLRERVKEKRITDPAAVKGELKAIIGEILGETPPLTLDGHPSVDSGDRGSTGWARPPRSASWPPPFIGRAIRCCSQ